MGEKLEKKYLNYNPGPADYDLNLSQSKNRPSSCKIGSSNRPKFEASKNPGPGTYFHNVLENSGPQIG